MKELDVLHEQALAEAGRQFGKKGVKELRVWQARSTRLLERRGWNPNTRLTTAQVADWFTERAQGLGSGDRAGLPGGFAPVAQKSFAPLPYFGDGRLTESRLRDTHGVDVWYEVYDLNAIGTGGIVGRLTVDWAVYVFIKTAEGWRPFVFALQPLSQSEKKRRAKEKAAKKARRKALQKSAGMPMAAPPYTPQGYPTFMRGDSA